MFNPETNRALIAASELINTAAGLHSAKPSPETLSTVEGLEAYLSARPAQLQWPSTAVNRKQLEQVRALRNQLHTLWRAAPVIEPKELDIINDLLQGVGREVVADSSGSGFRERPIPVSPQISDVMTATVAAALAFLVTHEETGRLRICRGEDCEAAIVDLTRNRSKLFCDFGNCANRAHVRAYRARQAARKDHEEYAGPARHRWAKPSAAEKAEQINRPTSATAIAAKEFRDRMREELMQKRHPSPQESKNV
ncbi:CGNR zinc finger domain-containing protein [Nesterenkonia sphaerica]|nr:CGNR zinc finger domain-containing protein [Nesterenkonia sphaerica]